MVYFVGSISSIKEDIHLINTALLIIPGNFLMFSNCYGPGTVLSFSYALPYIIITVL